MASSKGSPGPHDRKAEARPRCIKLGRYTGQRCKNNAGRGGKLCWRHLQEAQGKDGPAEAQAFSQKGHVAKELKKEAELSESTRRSALRKTVPMDLSTQRRNSRQTASDLVVTEQARTALARLGTKLGPNDKLDPKQALLDAVRSSYQQMSVWEQMLASTPEGDWKFVGSMPIPGNAASAKGARIEIIQKNLEAATKNAARTAKLAIDAGIEERLVRLAEDQAALIADTVKAAIIAAIGSMNLRPEAEAKAIQVALGAGAQQLRVLASGGSATDGLAPMNPYVERPPRDEIIDGIAVEVEKNPLDTEA